MTDASGKTKGFKDGTNQTTEYVYDANGNMKEDKNKGITSIEYNFLNLPKKVTFSASKFIEYTYDASGAKLSQKVVDGGTTKVSDYLGGFVYEDDKLQFLQHDEGRVVAERDESGSFDGFEYQYYLKDHLGNVRVTFKTEQEDPDNYLATFENDAATKNYESTYFSRYGEVTRINADIFDHTDDGTSKTYSSRLNGEGNEVYGLAKSLEVKPGDKVSAEVYAKYLDPSTTGASGSAFAQLIEDLSNNASTVVVDGATAGTDPIAPLAGLMDHSSDNSNGPKAYLNIVVIDREGNVEDISYAPVTSVAKEDGTDVPHQYLKTGTITVKEPGLAYIYLSNETGSRIEVFFDDFGVIHENTEIVQKDDYYPFGGSFNAYASPGSTEQNYKYNGKELQEETDWYDYGARMYDPWLGRWNHIDPLSDQMRRHSPYNYAFDNPVRFIDPDGMMPYDGKVLSSRRWNPFDYDNDSEEGSYSDWYEEVDDSKHIFEKLMIKPSELRAHFNEEKEGGKKKNSEVKRNNSSRNSNFEEGHNWIYDNREQIGETISTISNATTGYGLIKAGFGLVAIPSGGTQVAGIIIISDGTMRVVSSPFILMGIWSGDETLKNVPSNLLGGIGFILDNILEPTSNNRVYNGGKYQKKYEKLGDIVDFRSYIKKYVIKTIENNDR